jgi:hypothetical protein
MHLIYSFPENIITMHLIFYSQKGYTAENSRSYDLGVILYKHTKIDNLISVLHNVVMII